MGLFSPSEATTVQSPLLLIAAGDNRKAASLWCGYCKGWVHSYNYRVEAIQPVSVSAAVTVITQQPLYSTDTARLKLTLWLTRLRKANAKYKLNGINRWKLGCTEKRPVFPEVLQVRLDPITGWWMSSGVAECGGAAPKEPRLDGWLACNIG